jgi:2-polyprenyl-3-methyl-5-hydroxy-6-metoxy-1,4-benzoquinol methylase
VAPYFVNYGNKKKSNITAVERITANFMEYELPDNKKYDSLLCNQVLEHVPQPALFMKKLISLAKISIISVPFNWGDCGKLCNHATNHITNKKLLEWSAPHEPIYSGIIREKVNSFEFSRRILLVYEA